MSYAQVDTLEAVQIAELSFSYSVNNAYIQDLNNDNLTELVVSTAGSIHVYNVSNWQPIWISSPISNPRDLQFADLDGDSLIDIAAYALSHIYLFSPHDSLTIFSITVPTAYFKCYAVGDINSDGPADLAIVSQEPFEQGQREDSVWIDIYYGPDFIESDNFAITMENYYNSNQYYTDRFTQTASEILIASVGSRSNMVPRIFIDSYVEQFHVDSYMMISSHSYYGGYWIINPTDFHTIYNQYLGRSDTLGILNASDGTVVFSILSDLYTANSFYFPWMYTSKYQIGLFNSSRLLDTTRVAYSSEEQPVPNVPYWTSSVREFNDGNFSSELCFGFKDSLTEYSLLNRSRLWSRLAPVDSFEVEGVYNSNTLFSSSEIMLKSIEPESKYIFVNGVSHLVDAILPDTIPPISAVGDINTDGNDELLCVDSHTLRIYSLRAEENSVYDPSLPEGNFIISTYPNPFNSQTTISYSLPEKADVKIDIYDITGRKIESREEGLKPAGSYKLLWDAKDYSSGLYFYRIKAGDGSRTGRMILLK